MCERRERESVCVCACDVCVSKCLGEGLCVWSNADSVGGVLMNKVINN